ncbi:deoxynucleoside triphosphate triphosphohydrolase SAMHD1-like [Electrophorus electricus]|uniref:deoxynucleoside triphosphate triphosphohydrolase SAMHD1-like n=1 Tax=Electrophorus electricus TaxID=8005 RepID=UPI0015D04DEF|nr:deoxynucleoside triphosphate triphosphohydrolase SAMHD1-like [Electrophorus electricus]
MAEQNKKDSRKFVKIFKVFNDPIHGHIQLHPLLVKIIDTPHFQRLRNIKQLGGGYYVFPGASHNCFEHSIGVAHLAGKLVKNLHDSQKKERTNEEKEKEEKEELCVQIAGLCHDLGHGPFSHLFEEFMKKKDPNWKHEEQGITMFEDLIKDEEVDKEMEECKIEPQDIKFIKDLIRGITASEENIKVFEELIYREAMTEYKIESRHIEIIKKLIRGKKDPENVNEEIKQLDDLLKDKCTKAAGNYELKSEHIKTIKELFHDKTDSEHKSFLYEIVNNAKTGIDVDKMDYFSRDCHHLGMTSNFSHERYMVFARVCTNDDGAEHICMRDKEALNMYELFHVRNLLHHTAYQHKVKWAVEIMIFDALKEANKHIKLGGKNLAISEAAGDPKTYLQLTDDILHQIRWSSDDKLKTAQEIIERIEMRRLYRYIDGRTFEPDKVKPLNDNKKLEKKLKTWVDTIKRQPSDHQLSAEDFIVKLAKFNYGMKDKNPIDSLLFYSKEDPSKPFTMSKNKVSYFLPKRFSETKVMLFYKGEKKDVEKLAKEKIEAFWEEVKKTDQ